MHARAVLDIDSAYQTVIAVAARMAAFTTDDVWARLGEASDGRAIANALIRAEAEGCIRNSRIGVYLRGRQKHRRWVAVWLSLSRGATDDDALIYARAVTSTHPD
jgi:hypothetical protein